VGAVVEERLGWAKLGELETTGRRGKDGNKDGSKDGSKHFKITEGRAAHRAANHVMGSVKMQ
jgi:hypothetical protein